MGILLDCTLFREEEYAMVKRVDKRMADGRRGMCEDISRGGIQLQRVRREQNQKYEENESKGWIKKNQTKQGG